MDRKAARLGKLGWCDAECHRKADCFAGLILIGVRCAQLNDARHRKREEESITMTSTQTNGITRPRSAEIKKIINQSGTDTGSFAI